MKSLFIVFFTSTIIISCNYDRESNKASKVSEKVLQTDEMPTNHINGWADRCGFSFEFSSDTIWALGVSNIRYKKLNDSLFEIYYPEKNQILKDVRIDNYESGRYISFSNSGLGCCIDKTKNEIYFGADRLKFQILNNSSIKVFYPKKTVWKISRISEREVYIYNEKNKVKYTAFMD